MVKKVNLGCGPIGKEDWINVDWGILAILHKFTIIEKILTKLNLFPKGYNIPWPKNLKLHNCRKKLPFASNSIDCIYTSHFLEHFKKFEAEKVISDCFRVLKNEGSIRIIVPDLEIMVKKYLENDIKYFKKLKSLSNFNKQAEESGWAGLSLADALVENFYPDFYKDKPSGISKFMSIFVRPHQWLYDYQSLKCLLGKTGFRNIQKKSFKEGKSPDLDHLDVFPEISLYVEAEK